MFWLIVIFFISLPINLYILFFVSPFDSNNGLNYLTVFTFSLTLSITITILFVFLLILINFLLGLYWDLTVKNIVFRSVLFFVACFLIIFLQIVNLFDISVIFSLVIFNLVANVLISINNK